MLCLMQNTYANNVTMTIMLYNDNTHSSNILSSQSIPNCIQNINKCQINQMICMILNNSKCQVHVHMIAMQHLQ